MSGSKYYDRRGQPITADEWAAALANIQIAVTFVGSWRVSTVWLGLDHSLDGGPPLIFETMVFGKPDAHSDCWRYSTEEEAREGHARVVEDLRERQALLAR